MTVKQWPRENAFCRRVRSLKLATLATFHGRNFAETVRKQKILFPIFVRVIAAISGAARLQEIKLRRKESLSLTQPRGCHRIVASVRYDREARRKVASNFNKARKACRDRNVS